MKNLESTEITNNLLSDISSNDIAIFKSATAEQVLKTVNLDGETFADEYTGVAELLLACNEKQPQMYTIAEDKRTGELLGYVNMILVEDENFEKILSGEIADNEINADIIADIEIGGRYNVWGWGALVHEDLRKNPQSPNPVIANGEVWKSLSQAAFAEKFDEMEKHGITIDKIGGENTPDGRKMAEKIFGAMPVSAEKISSDGTPMVMMSTTREKQKAFLNAISQKSPSISTILNDDFQITK